LVAAVERTTRWAERCLAARKPGQALFGIIQGGTDVELRLQHAEALGRLPLDGLALGGFSVGEPPESMYHTLERVVPGVDPERPRYLMGVGTPLDLVRAVSVGVDLFDCVLPTRNARNGQAFVSGGRLTVKNARYRTDPRPLDEACSCPVCSQGFSRAYLRHLYVAGEILGHRLISLHNLHHYAALMASARRAISEGQLERWIQVMSPHENRSGDSEGS
jgi:queuine tRNA-ribosyltransferase